MKDMNIDVTVVDVPSIFRSTQYKRDLFLIQVYVRRGKGHLILYPYGNQTKPRTKKKRIGFMNTLFLLSHQ
jgi:hypothetical protein